MSFGYANPTSSVIIVSMFDHKFKLVGKKQPLYEWLALAFLTTLLVSNIASIKIVSIGGLVFDAGTILFPMAYIISDVVTEVYGFRRMRSLLAKGVVMLLAMSIVFWIVELLPSAADWGMQMQYSQILGVVWRIVLASIVAIFVGEFMNAYLLAKMKISSKGENLWARLIGSSAVGSAIDTVIFSTIAFAGTMPVEIMVRLILSVYAIKMLVEIAISPITIDIINRIKKHEKIDTFEKPTLF